MIGWAAAWLVTITLEVPLVAACAPRGMRRCSALDALLANSFTHPLAWIAVAHHPGAWLPVEGALMVAEALAYGFVTRMPWRRAACAAALANGTTAALSLLWWH